MISHMCKSSCMSVWDGWEAESSPVSAYTNTVLSWHVCERERERERERE